MPKISDAKREARRAEILHAAWTCFQREGLHETTMQDIIRACGLSAGAVYGYFRTKDDLIVEAVTTSLSGVGRLVTPLLQRDPLPPPEEVVRDIAAAVSGFATREGFDLKRVALLGWAEAQRNDRLREAMRAYYLGFRQEIAKASATWRRDGLLAIDADPDVVAKAMLSLVLGYLAQSALLGDVEPADLAAGLAALRRG